MIPRSAIFVGRTLFAVLFVLSSGGLAQAPAEESAVAGAVRTLLAAADGEDEQATNKAAKAVNALGEPAAAVLAGLPETTAPRRLVWALRCLRVHGSSVGRDFAAALTKHADASVRVEALVTAADLMGDAVAPLCLAATKDADTTVRRRAFDGLLLVAAETKEAGAAAAIGVMDADFWAADVAVRILFNQPAPKAGEPDVLSSAVAQSAPSASRDAALSVYAFLARRSPKAARTAVERGLSSDRPEIRIAAVRTIAELRADDLASRAAALASDSEFKVAKAAIETVATLNDPSTLESMIDLLETAPDKARREAVAVALRRMTGKLHGYDVAAWRRELAKR
jgi:hypothetical protein